jgi:phospholipase/carboxylesterase
MTAPRTDLALTHLLRPARMAHTGQPPLLVQLHGVGSNEADLFSFADRLDPRFVIVSARGPLTRGPNSYAWFDVDFLPDGNFHIAPDQLFASRDLIAQFIADATAAYATDPERVYLLGFSQGAIMSVTTTLTQPDHIAGAAIMSGRLPPEVLPQLAPASALRGVPIFVAHGTHDGVITIDHARALRDELEHLPVTLDYREYSERHEISPPAFFDMHDWLAARLDGPRRLTADGTNERA